MHNEEKLNLRKKNTYEDDHEIYCNNDDVD